jgi:hypothetical protein
MICSGEIAHEETVMTPIFAIIGSAALAAALLSFAWTMQKRQRRNGRANDDSDDAVVGMFPGL